MPEPRVGDILAGKYRIDGVLGTGGSGTVYAATHVVTDKRTALKWLRPELATDQVACQRAIQEARASALIQHPNIVDIYDVSSHEGFLFLIMEYLYGETLYDTILRERLTPEALIHLLMPALRGVAAAHRSGVIHRDIKPENIFLCRGPEGAPREAKVLDFGIAKVIAPEARLSKSLTISGKLVGTPYYMSPEQTTRPKAVDYRSDVYAFGVILYEAMSGEIPYDADTVSMVFIEISRGKPIPLHERRPDLPRKFTDVVMKAMAHQPEDRFQDIESLARALMTFAPEAHFDRDPTGGHMSMPAPPVGEEAGAETVEVPSRASSDAPAVNETRDRPSRGLLLGGLAVLVVLAVGLWVFTQVP